MPARKEPDLTVYSARCGARLRKLRERSGMTVDAVAESIGVSYRTIYKWERGDADPPYNTLPSLAKLYGLKSPRSVLSEE